MSIFDNLVLGFATAISLQNLLLAFTGCFVGTLIGVLPGIGPLATMAMLLPLTYYFPPESSLIMLAGIYYGAQYGGSTTAILVNLPGESSSAVTCIDGHQMARNGRAGAALAVAALASFFAGTVSTGFIAFFAPVLSEFALSFGQADYFSLMLLGVVGATVVAGGSLLKSISMVLAGILLGCVGIDVNTGVQRYTGGLVMLLDGIQFVALTIGIFGIADILVNLMRAEGEPDVLSRRISGLWPSSEEFSRAWPATLRGTFIGSLLGILPGGGATLASFASYTVERKISRTPERFGKGAVEGVAGPESANNAGAQTSFIPMLTLGIPSNAIMAIMIGALMMQGIVPGPQVMTQRPEIVWGVIASMWIGNLMLVVINLPLVGLWVYLLKVPYRLLFPAIILFCCIGAYGVNSSAAEVILTAVMSLFGFLLLRYDCPPAPLALGFVLGPMMEENFRRALVLSRGSLSTFVTHPISLCLLLAACGLLISVAVPNIARFRKTALADSEV